MTIFTLVHTSIARKLCGSIFLLAVTFFLVTSCTKKTLDTNNALYPSKIRNYSRSQIKLMYALLTPAEKQAEWFGHIQYGITQIPASHKQRVFVDELLKRLNVSYFERPLGEIYDRLREIETEAHAIFPDKMHYIYLFGGLENDYRSFTTFYSPQLMAGDKKCNCSSQSDYCPGAMSCPSESSCLISDGGCGTIWRYECDGICK